MKVVRGPYRYLGVRGLESSWGLGVFVFLWPMLVVTFFLYHFCEMFFKRVASEFSFSIVLHLNRFRLAWSRFQFPKSARAVNYPLPLGTIIRQVSH